MVGFFEGNRKDIYNRMSELLKDSPYKKQIEQLYLNSNLSDIIASKPSELLLSERPVFESGKEAGSKEQAALNRLVEENDIHQLIYNFTVGAAIRGDAFLKVYHDYRNDYSELEALGLPKPVDAKRETVIQTVNPSYVFPELAKGSSTAFKAVNIAYVQWLDKDTGDTSLIEPTPRANGTSLFKKKQTAVPYLIVERHLAGFIIHEKYLLTAQTVALVGAISVPVYNIVEKVDTGLEVDVVITGTPVPLVFHFAYKQTDTKWRGVGAIEKIAAKLVAISDRLTALDWVIHKHSDPILTGPEIEGMGDMVRLGGAYISRTNDDPDVKFVTWDAKLDHAFRELDILYSEVFAMAQLPSFLFGSSITSAQSQGGGTSHTDGTTTKLRYAPVSALLDRLNTSLAKCLGDTLYYAQVLENYANKHDDTGEAIDGFEAYEPSFPTIKLSNGIPANDAETTDIIVLRYTSGLIDKQTAIKQLDRVDDDHAMEMIKRIEADQIKQREDAILPQGALGSTGLAPKVAREVPKEGEKQKSEGEE
jgi:hypothetical protein